MGIGAKQKVVLICHVNIIKGKNQAFALLNFYCNKSAIIAINAIIAIIQ